MARHRLPVEIINEAMRYRNSNTYADLRDKLTNDLLVLLDVNYSDGRKRGIELARQSMHEMIAGEYGVDSWKEYMRKRIDAAIDAEMEEE